MHLRSRGRWCPACRCMNPRLLRTVERERIDEDDREHEERERHRHHHHFPDKLFARAQSKEEQAVLQQQTHHQLVLHHADPAAPIAQTAWRVGQYPALLVVLVDALDGAAEEGGGGGEGGAPWERL